MSEHIVPSVKSSIKGFASTVKSFKERQLEAQDAAADQTIGKTQSQAVKPSTISSAPRCAANAGSSRRAGPGESKATGTFKVSGKLKGVIGDWLKQAMPASKALDANLTALKVAKDAGDDETADLLGQVIQALLERFQKTLLPRGQDLAAQVAAEAETVQGEQSTDTQTGLSEFHGKAAGAPEDDCPANQANRTGMDAAAMDAGLAGVLDHFAAVGEPGTPTNPYVMDGLRMERARRRAMDITVATNPERVRAGLDDTPLVGDSASVYAQLNFERDHSAE